ncbi:DNA alkylation repair protein [Brevibacterium ammoniilyticum]|uniref:DNA alkylation repair protein n=1 Tax=Brevibacterium ammoniilyticum TaxID=1046555 RepID=A0ABP9U800_9MICO
MTAPKPGTVSADTGQPLTIAEAIAAELRLRGTPERAAKEKAYLKSPLDHCGVSVPETRSIVTAQLRSVEGGAGAGVSRDFAVAVAEALWETPIHELRSAAVMVLITAKDHLGGDDAPLIERFLRESRTWALVDPLAGDLVGPLTEVTADFDPVLERWAVDKDFWLRRSALLAHLRPLRAGGGDFDRFSRFADVMLQEREFFIRKAIGWVLRDTAKKRPDLVFEWLLPRARRASGVTIREAIRPLSPEQQAAIRAADRSD